MNNTIYHNRIICSYNINEIPNKINIYFINKKTI